MPLKSLIVIALRLYAIFWLLEGISGFTTALPVFLSFSAKLDMSGYYYFSYFLIPGEYLLLAMILWVISAKLSSQVTKGHDTQLAFTSLTQADLYRFAFVFLGIYFVLSSISATLQTAYKFFTYDFPSPETNPQRGQFLWPFLGHGLTLIAGFTCVLGASNWSKKLIYLESKNDPPSDT